MNPIIENLLRKKEASQNPDEQLEALATRELLRQSDLLDDVKTNQKDFIETQSRHEERITIIEDASTRLADELKKAKWVFLVAQTAAPVALGVALWFGLFDMLKAENVSNLAAKVAQEEVRKHALEDADRWSDLQQTDADILKILQGRDTKQ